MAKLSQIDPIQRFPLEIKLRPYLMDHRFAGKAVFPAVEAMQMLAASARDNLTGVHTEHIVHAAFDKFIVMTADQHTIQCVNEVRTTHEGLVESKLVTRITSKKLAISRQKEHVTLAFQSQNSHATDLPVFEDLMSLEGRSFQISADRVYRELVPFGPAYHNLTHDLLISDKGVVANLAAPAHEAPAAPLGSPFPLDAAFHAACVWCQCFLKFIGFPVGFEKRVVLRPTVPGKTYVTRIIPQKTSPDLLICDLWINSPDGAFFEIISGLKMKDVSAGRQKPPQWVTDLQSTGAGQ